MSRAGAYIEKCRDAERIRPMFVPDVDSKFNAEITTDGVFRLQKEESVFIMTVEEARRFVGWVVRIVSED